MTAQTTSRRALLQGAALTAIPVAALGGVPLFAVVEDTLPLPAPDLATFEGRLAACCDWFGLTPPALTYDPEDLAGGPLLTEDLLEWMRATGRPMAGWLLSGEPAGYTREAALADRAEWLADQPLIEALSHLDATEKRLLLDGIERGQSGIVPFEVALEECRQAIEAHRARLAA